MPHTFVCSFKYPVRIFEFGSAEEQALSNYGLSETICLKSFAVNLQAATAFAFGLLEGYKVLYDRVELQGLIRFKQKELQMNWVYDKEAEAWIQKKLTPTSKLLKSS